jgi:hypothetical protein
MSDSCPALTHSGIQAQETWPTLLCGKDLSEAHIFQTCIKNI